MSLFMCAPMYSNYVVVFMGRPPIIELLSYVTVKWSNGHTSSIACACRYNIVVPYVDKAYIYVMSWDVAQPSVCSAH